MPEPETHSLATRVDDASRKAGLFSEKPAEDSAARGMQSGMEFGIAILVCALLGLAADKWLNTKPLFMLLGLFLGMATGIWNMYRASMGGSALSVGIKTASLPSAETEGEDKKPEERG